MHCVSWLGKFIKGQRSSLEGDPNFNPWPHNLCALTRTANFMTHSTGSFPELHLSPTDLWIKAKAWQSTSPFHLINQDEHCQMLPMPSKYPLIQELSATRCGYHIFSQHPSSIASAPQNRHCSVKRAYLPWYWVTMVTAIDFIGALCLPYPMYPDHFSCCKHKTHLTLCKRHSA